MKSIFLVVVILTTLPLSAQVINLDGSATRAVVVGISDYQDEDIPDLRFADKDAEAFANFLRSPAGGTLPDDNIQLLLNENATLGKLVTALGWLLEASKENDRAIIYFSGHGDVDAKLYGQPGFLLTWDTPAQMYMAGGYGLLYFQIVITTLSEQNKAKVVVITDACHAGKLAGSSDGVGSGAQLTAASLANQFANEVKILSCQPGEFSLEGEQWGGGRGAFSYHLVDGLNGMADGNADASVTLSEIDRYLEDNVTREVAPMQQTPMVVGDKKALLAQVSPEALAQWRQNKKGQPSQFSPIEQRGLEEETLAKVDTSIRKLYLAFKQALKDKVFLEPAGSCADAYYEKLMAVAEMKPLHGAMTRNYAAGLMDEGQQVTNKLLKTDPEVVSDALSRPFVFDHIHRYLNRASQLLGEGHFFYKPLMARQRYFEAKTYRAENYPDMPADSLNAIYLRKLNEGLGFDSLAAYIYLELALNCGWVLGDFLCEIEYGKKAIELAPHSAVAHFMVGEGYCTLGKAEAISHFEQAIAIDSSFLPSYLWLAFSYGDAGNHEKYQHFFIKYVSSVRALIHANRDSVPVLYYGQLGNALSKLGFLEEAEAVTLEAVKRSKGQAPTAYRVLMSIYATQGKWKEGVLAGEKFRELNPGGYGFNLEVAYFHKQAGDAARAEELSNQAASMALANHDLITASGGWRMLGDLYLEQGRQAEAKVMFETILKHSPEPTDGLSLNFIARAQYVLFGEKAMWQTINRFLRENPDERFFGEYQIPRLLASAGKEEEALEWLERSIANYPHACWMMLANGDFVSLRQTEGWKALCRKCFPDQVKD